MSSPPSTNFDILVLGAGPAGVVAALRAARLGARTGLVTRDALGGMAASDGPVPVRTLAHAARLMREAGRFPKFGIQAPGVSLDYATLLHRVGQVVADVQAHSVFQEDLEQSGVAVHEHAGPARFVDSHLIEYDHGRRLRAEKIIICTGGTSRRLGLPGAELTSTHSDAWALSAVPPSMLVIGAGATGVQVASIFNTFGSQVTLFETAPHILMTEDEDVAAAMSAALQASGIRVLENAGRIDRFDGAPAGVRMTYSNQGAPLFLDANLIVVAAGWMANTADLNLAAAGVQLDQRGYLQVDSQLRTSARHVFAAGDVTGHVMVVHEAVREGYVAATNAVLGKTDALPAEVSPLGSFTDPEYASVGITEATARQRHQVVVGVARFDSLPRPIIDDRPGGFCKLVVDQQLHTILGCHIVGERAVELAQLAAVAMAAGQRVEQLALVPFSFPTYANALGRAALQAARQLDLPIGWGAGHLADEAGGL